MSVHDGNWVPGKWNTGAGGTQAWIGPKGMEGVVRDLARSVLVRGLGLGLLLENF